MLQVHENIIIALSILIILIDNHKIRRKMNLDALLIVFCCIDSNYTLHYLSSMCHFIRRSIISDGTMKCCDGTEVISNNESSKTKTQGSRHLGQYNPQFNWRLHFTASCNCSVSGISLNNNINNMADKTDSERKSKGERSKGKEEKRKRKHSENDDIELAKHYETLLVYDFLKFVLYYILPRDFFANVMIVHERKVNKVLNFSVRTFFCDKTMCLF